MRCPNCQKDYLRPMRQGFYCFSCGQRTGDSHIGSAAVGADNSQQRVRQSLALPLDLVKLAWLESKYGITEAVAREFDLQQCLYRGKEWIYLPIWGPERKEIHAQLRFYGKADNDHKYKTFYRLPKGTFWFSEYFRYHIAQQRYNRIVICEGIFDAIRCAEFVPAVAIMGSYLTTAQKSGILNISHEDTKFIIAMDPDAFEAGVKIAKQLGSGRCRVLQLSDDPAGLSSSDLSFYLS